MDLSIKSTALLMKENKSGFIQSGFIQNSRLVRAD
ncbi:hypothetical protein HNQ92_004237 [Rhabdobacter roseus]|uniref:Uncharacterized protein n=1 Tax=Rhabdobacter roseus TaxID=1655419 RepID=A0A840TWW5_9BACT|nr:hypothetical protein [Rhabdobacter roseus]